MNVHSQDGNGFRTSLVENVQKKWKLHMLLGGTTTKD